MMLLYAVAVGAVIAAGAYMLLERNVVRVLFGLALLSSGANLIIFLSGRVGDTLPAIIPVGDYALPEGAANPLPQALVLTAIVIGFALIAMASILAYRASRALGTMDSDAMTAARDEGDPFDSEPRGKR